MTEKERIQDIKENPDDYSLDDLFKLAFLVWAEDNLSDNKEDEDERK